MAQHPFTGAPAVSFAPKLITVIATDQRQVAWRGQGPTLLYNRSETVPVYLGAAGFDVGGQTVHIIDPLGSVPVNTDPKSESDIVAQTLTGSAVLQSTPGAGTATPSPAQIAAQIALKGINVNIQGITVVSPSGDVTGAADVTAFTNAFALTSHVIAGPGTFYIPTNSILAKLTSRQWLQGSGYSTIFKLVAADANLFGVMLGNVDKENQCRFSDFLIDGNNSAQTGGAWQTGMLLSNSAAGPLYTDGRHQVSHVFIQNMTGDGFVQTGRGGSSITDVSIWTCNGFGLNVHEDSYYGNIDIGSVGLDGILEQGASNQFANVKAFFCGAALVSGRGAGATLLTVNAPTGAGAPAYDGAGIAGLQFSLANGWGNGHVVANISAAAISNAGSGGLCHGYYQDNARAGYANLQGSQRRTVILTADSNNNCGTSSGIIPNANYAGVDLSVSNCVIKGSSFDRGANVNHQAAALNLSNTSGGNDVELAFAGSLNDASNMPPLTAANPIPPKANIVFKATGGFSYFNPAYGATYTPDPFTSVVHEITITGNIAIGTPALSGTNTTGTFMVAGMRLTIILVEDGTGGHTVSFAPGVGGFVGASAANTAANKVNIWEFLFDGFAWQQTNYQAN